MRLEKQRGASLTPRAVLKDAQSRRSPLHQYFEWDDGAAAKKYRLWQARRIVNQLTIYIQDEDEEAIEVRAFHSLELSDGRNGTSKSDRAYMSLETVCSDANLRAQLLSQALAEANTWRAKYMHLKEVAPIVAAIEVVNGKTGDGDEMRP